MNKYLWAFLILAISISASFIWAENTGFIRYECVSEGVVVSIDKANYRSVLVTLESGEQKWIMQPRDLVPGTTVCFKKERIYDF